MGVTVPKSWKEKIEAVALATGKSVSAVVREALKPWIERNDSDR